MYQISLSVVALLILAAGCDNDTTESNADRDVAPQLNEVVALGKLVPKSGIINVGATPGDQIQELRVDIGSEVNQDDVLVVLASQTIRSKELQVARARLADAQKNVDIQRSLAEDQLALAQAAQADQAAFEKEKMAAQELIDVQNARVAQARKRLDEIRDLFGSPDNENQQLITANELAEAELALAQATAEFKQASTQLELAVEKNRLQTANTQANIQLAQRQLEAAVQTPLAALNAAVELAEANVSLATVRAPISGTIVNLFHRQGDLVGSQPVLRMANLDEMICVAEVYESQLALIDPRASHTVEISSPALRAREGQEELVLRGVVFAKSALIGKATLVDPNPLAPQDRRSAEVYIQLDESSQSVARDFVNLQARVRIHLRDHTGPSTSSR